MKSPALLVGGEDSNQGREGVRGITRGPYTGSLAIGYTSCYVIVLFSIYMPVILCFIACFLHVSTYRLKDATCFMYGLLGGAGRIRSSLLSTV